MMLTCAQSIIQASWLDLNWPVTWHCSALSLGFVCHTSAHPPVEPWLQFHLPTNSILNHKNLNNSTNKHKFIKRIRSLVKHCSRTNQKLTCGHPSDNQMSLDLVSREIRDRKQSCLWCGQY